MQTKKNAIKPDRTFRQGDVYLVRADIPAEAQAVTPRDMPELTTLAYGEATGHRHAVPTSDAIMLSFKGQTFLRVLEETELKHGNPLHAWAGDHDTLKLPAGDWQVVIDREYQPKGWRRVID